jgi:hypothetical protein
MPASLLMCCCLFPPLRPRPQAKALRKPPRAEACRPSQGGLTEEAEESPSKRPRVQDGAA